MDTWGDKILWNNPLREWAICIGIIVFSLIILRLLKFVVIKKIRAFSMRTKTTFDDFLVEVIQSSVMPLLYVLAIFSALKYINLPGKAADVIRVAMLFIVTFFVLRMITSFIGYAFKRAVLKKEKNEHRGKQAKGILLILQVIVWFIGILFLIDNLGYDITTVIAGLGIGGIAIALAAQAILGDLFSYLVIFFDKPFEIGDFIIVGDKMGTIEYIGIKTTRIRALTGEQLVCSNTDLTNSRLHNYKRMQERRVAFTFGVVYNVPAPKLRLIPKLVADIVRSLDNVRFDRAHFQSFGDFSLNFEVVYFILSPDYNLYMDKQQEINLKMIEAFKKEQIEFAFPTQTILFNNENGKRMTRVHESTAEND
jgi:small-conductance mechanosensitive channel